MTRREFLELTGAAVGLAALGGLVPAAGAAVARPPNILLIISDEHQAAVTGCYGSPLARTPALDGLAQRGVVFENCYTASPLCVPARLALTSGRYISRVSAWNNSCWLPDPNMPTLPRQLVQAGYETVLCGKMHYDRTQRYGFQVDMGLHNNSFMTGTGKRRAADDLAPQPGISERFTGGFKVAGEGQSPNPGDEAVRSKAIEYIRGRRQGDKPFFLLAGFIAPHFPFRIPEKYWLPYKDRVPMPRIPPGFLDSLPLNYQHLRIGFNMEDVPDATVKLGRELYHGYVQWLDEQIGALLKAVDENQGIGETVVIYTTDHGENLGEHGLWWKNAVYDQAARVPLIVSWPRRWQGGQRRRGACSHLDLVPTIAGIAGARVPAEWDGDSLGRWMDDPAAPWKDLAVSQYYAHNICSGYAMIRQGRYKYVHHSAPDDRHPAEEELYDLEADPGEFTNLARRPEAKETCQAMLAALRKEIGEHPDETEKRCRAEMAQGYGRKGAKKGPAGDGDADD